MLFGGGWPFLTRERAIVLILALIGLGWLLLQIGGNSTIRASGWPGAGITAGSTAPGQANSLSAAMAPVGRGPFGANIPADQVRPHGNPLAAANSVMTQGYGVGTHAPAEIWGAIDLAIDGDGDGKADPEGSWGHPIRATHSGSVKVTRDSWPAGNHVWVANDQYRTGYAHLQEIAVSDGQQVQRGDVIGHMGSTGMSSGPHLDYQVWQALPGGGWLNVNPLDYAGLATP